MNHLFFFLMWKPGECHKEIMEMQEVKALTIAYKVGWLWCFRESWVKSAQETFNFPCSYSFKKFPMHAFLSSLTSTFSKSYNITKVYFTKLCFICPRLCPAVHIWTLPAANSIILFVKVCSISGLMSWCSIFRGKQCYLRSLKSLSWWRNNQSYHFILLSVVSSYKLWHIQYTFEPVQREKFQRGKYRT